MMSRVMISTSVVFWMGAIEVPWVSQDNDQYLYTIALLKNRVSKCD